MPKNDSQLPKTLPGIICVQFDIEALRGTGKALIVLNLTLNAFRTTKIHDRDYL